MMTMMTNATGSTPTTPTPSGSTSNTPSQPITGTQGQSTLGYGSNYSYNPYPSPYPTGLPGSSILGLNPYGGGQYGYNQFGGNPYGGGQYGYNQFGGNPYGGYNNSTGTGGLNPQTGLAPGYGFESAVSPTVFQGALSGDGTLSPVHPGRLAQEYIGRENGERKSGLVGLAVGTTAAFAMMATPNWMRLRPTRGFFQTVLALGIGVAAGTAAKLAVQPSLETLSKNVALSQDVADNGHIDNSRILQRNFDPNISLLNSTF